jgi:hypothetical protein
MQGRFLMYVVEVAVALGAGVGLTAARHRSRAAAALFELTPRLSRRGAGPAAPSAAPAIKAGQEAAEGRRSRVTEEDPQAPCWGDAASPTRPSPFRL